MPIEEDISPPVGDKALSITNKSNPEMSNMKSYKPEGAASIMMQRVSPINEAPQPSTSFSTSYRNVPGGAGMDKDFATLIAELSPEEFELEGDDIYYPVGHSESIKAVYDQLLGEQYDALQAKEKSFGKLIEELKDQQEKSGNTDLIEEIKKCEILQQELLKRLQESKYSENIDEDFMKKRIKELYFMKSAMKKFSEEKY